MSVRLNGKITWTNEVRKLSDLKIWPDNPKTLTAETAEYLETSIEHFGLAIPLLISPTNDIYDGNQRTAVMEHMGDYGPDALIDVRVSNRPLTAKERRELVIRLRENQADWNLDMLADWDMGELGEWGFDADLLAGIKLPSDFREYDESIAGEVQYVECPQCGHKFPK